MRKRTQEHAVRNAVQGVERSMNRGRQKGMQSMRNGGQRGEPGERQKHREQRDHRAKQSLMDNRAERWRQKGTVNHKLEAHEA